MMAMKGWLVAAMVLVLAAHGGRADSGIIWDYNLAFDMTNGDCSQTSGGVLQSFSIPSSVWVDIQGQGTTTCFRNRKTHDQQRREYISFGCAVDNVVTDPVTNIKISKGWLAGASYDNKVCAYTEPDGASWGSYYTMPPGTFPDLSCHPNYNDADQTWKLADGNTLHLRYRGCQAEPYNISSFPPLNGLPNGMTLALTGYTNDAAANLQWTTGVWLGLIVSLVALC